MLRSLSQPAGLPGYGNSHMGDEPGKFMSPKAVTLCKDIVLVICLAKSLAVCSTSDCTDLHNLVSVYILITLC